MAADQKVSNVEKLVDDLCEKLREIEGQQNSVDESQFTDSTEIKTMKRVSVSICVRKNKAKFLKLHNLIPFQFNSKSICS